MRGRIFRRESQEKGKKYEGRIFAHGGGHTGDSGGGLPV